MPSVPGLLASSLGRLMIEPYTAQMPKGGTRTYGGVPVAGQWDGKRFIYTHGSKTYRLARLICEAFNGPPQTDRSVCMHMDENSRNNRPSNLEWGTQKQNLNAPGFLAHCRSRVGDASPFTKGRRRKQAGEPVEQR